MTEVVEGLPVAERSVPVVRLDEVDAFQVPVVQDVGAAVRALEQKVRLLGAKPVVHLVVTVGRGGADVHGFSGQSSLERIGESLITLDSATVIRVRWSTGQMIVVASAAAFHDQGLVLPQDVQLAFAHQAQKILEAPVPGIAATQAYRGPVPRDARLPVWRIVGGEPRLLCFVVHVQNAVFGIPGNTAHAPARPEPELQPLCVSQIRQRPHTTGEFPQIVPPVTHFPVPACIHNEGFDSQGRTVLDAVSRLLFVDLEIHNSPTVIDQDG